MYAFLRDGRGILIFRTDNEAEAKDVIVRKGLHVLAENQLLA